MTSEICPFNVNKCHVLQVGRKKQKSKCERNSLKLKNIQAPKILMLQLHRTSNCLSNKKDATSKANNMMGIINIGNKELRCNTTAVHQPSQIPPGKCFAILIAKECKGYGKIKSCKAKCCEDDHIFA